jgi:hypothetical protein
MGDLMISRRGRKGRRMKKFLSVLVFLILVLTIFSSFNFIAQPVSASPPLSGDKAFANATVSYYSGYKNYLSNTYQLGLTQNVNSSFSTVEFSTTPGNPVPFGGWYVYSTHWFSLSGVSRTSSSTITLDALEIALKKNGGNYQSGWAYVNLSVSGTVYSYYTSWGSSSTNPYYIFNPSYTISSAGVYSFELNITVFNNFNSANSIWTETSDTNQGLTTTNAPEAPINFDDGYTQSGPVTSTFSLIPNIKSFNLNWSASNSVTSTYNSAQQTGTSGVFTGSLSILSVSFQISSLTTFSETVSYYLDENNFTSLSGTYQLLTSEYGISEDGQFFNSTPMYFNLTISGENTYYPASYSVKISNLTLTNPSAPIDQLSLNSQNFTYYSLSKYKNTYNVTAYKNFTNAQSAYIKFSTSELVNYYPTVNYDTVKWTGTGSKAELIVNASNVGGGYIFSSESFQILNINWGDGSALQSSSEQTGSYNWTIYHYYQAAGSYSVSFQVENWIGNANALSTTKTLTYTISITISNSPANNAIIQSGQKIWFNWTNQNAGMTSVSLKIDSILQESNTYSSQLSESISFSPTYLGTLSISWYWTAGNISGYDNLTYSTSTHVGKTGLYVLVNYTVSSTSYSSYYYYSQVSPSGTNFTWAYFTWNIQLPPGATLQSIKGNTTWIFQSGYPGLYVYYKGNASIHFYLNSSSYQVVWLAPLPPSFGYFTIEYAPTSPVMQMLGIGISSNAFKTYVNGIQVPSLQIPSQMGQTYNIKAYDTFGNLVVNTTYTPEYQFSTDEIPVSYFPVTWTNLNSSWKIQLTIASNGVTLWGLPHIMPEGGELTLYMPPGTYWFNATYLGYLNNTPGPSIDKLYSVSNVTDEIFSGITLAIVETTAVRNAQNLTQLVDSVNITFVNSNSKIYNETLKINASIVNTNSSIAKQVLDENTTINNIYSKVSTINSDIQVIQNNILSDVNSTRINITTRVTTIKDLVSLSLQEENSTFSYQLKFGTPSVQGETYEFPVFVTLFNGQMANLSVTQQAWQNLKLYYVTGNSTYPLNFSVSNEQAGSFVINIYNVTPAMAAGISSGQGLITAQGEVKEGVLTNLAAGIIGSQQVQYSSSSLWTDIFGIQPPNANDSVSGMFQYLSWLDESYAGRAIYMIVVLSALTYYLVMINMKLEERRKKK